MAKAESCLGVLLQICWGNEDSVCETKVKISTDRCFASRLLPNVSEEEHVTVSRGCVSRGCVLLGSRNVLDDNGFTPT